MASQSIEPIHFVDLKDNINTKSPILGALFLFFLLFFTFLFVYFMYTCSNNHRGGGGEANAPLSGLDPSVINRLPVVTYGSSCHVMIGDNNKPSSPEAAECAICLGTLQRGEKFTVLPLCSHGFHSDCVDRWLRTRSSCPLCRSCVV